MKKKLILNKETIAQLTNPHRVFGGEGGAGPVQETGGGATCVGGILTCGPPTQCWVHTLEMCQSVQVCPLTDTCPSMLACPENPPTYLP